MNKDIPTKQQLIDTVIHLLHTDEDTTAPDNIQKVMDYCWERRVAEFHNRGALL